MGDSNTNWMASIDKRLGNIETALRDKVEKNGEQNVQISGNTQRIGELEKRGQWSLKRSSLYIGIATLCGGLLGNMPKLVSIIQQAMK